MKKSQIQKYFRSFTPLSTLIRPEYVKYKLDHRAKSDTVNYEKQLEYNWCFCNRCWRRFSNWDIPDSIEIEWHEFSLCQSCYNDKINWIRNIIIDIEDLVEKWIDIKRVFELKMSFYKKFR